MIKIMETTITAMMSMTIVIFVMFMIIYDESCTCFLVLASSQLLYAGLVYYMHGLPV